jgi:predicted NAD/FAD-dependent oxidoreductase
VQVDKLVIATQPEHAATLLAGVQHAPVLPVFDYEPITTCYLQYPREFKLPLPFMALIDDAASHAWGQFVFDRGQLTPHQAGLLAVVVSASHQAIENGHAALSASVAHQLAATLHDPALEQPLWSKVITEKRATFSCTPDLHRPPSSTACDTLCIAGDYTAGDYPGTLEAAIRSGIGAARLISA